VNGVVWYVDTSAFLKLVVDETSSRAMRDWSLVHDGLWSSHLLRTEALRAAQRLEISSQTIEEALETIALVLPSVGTYASAGRLQPKGLRSLDALHVASALELGTDLEGMVVYDQRVSAAAQELSIAVVAPT